MGNVLCCEQSTERQQKNPQQQTQGIQNEPQQTYYTNPAVRDEDFTFNDKLKLQSMTSKYEGGYVPNFPSESTSEEVWYNVAQSVVTEINRVNSESDWANQSIKSGLELIYSQNDEKIYFGSKIFSQKQIEKMVPFIPKHRDTSPLRQSYQAQNQHQACSFKNSQTNNSLQGGPTLLSNPNLNKDKGDKERETVNFQGNSFQAATFSANGMKDQQVRDSKAVSNPRTISQNGGSTAFQCLNTVKLEFEVGCGAEKLLKGITHLKQFTSKIEKIQVIQGSPNKEFQIQHIQFSKQMQKVQRDMVVAHYSTDIGQNLNNCYASVNHYKVPELPDITRMIVTKAGHTFFEHYLTANEPTTPLGNSQNSGNENGENNQNGKNLAAFGSMNLNIGSVKTKVRFYGEFLCKSSQEENVVKMVFLTEFRDYISICKTIAQSQELQLDQEDASDHLIQNEDDLEDSDEPIKEKEQENGHNDNANNKNDDQQETNYHNGSFSG